MNSRSAEHNQK